MIGIFDSGLGGLTAYKELHNLLPAGDFVYFGDTGRVPYGSRSREILTRYARQDIRFLLRQGADVILAACGTVSSVVLDDIRSEFSIPLFGVVDASVNAALAATKNEKIGVIGTGATISSGAFAKKIAAANPHAAVTSIACPLFVPLVENGYIGRGCEVTKRVAADYLAPLRDEGIDTLILACTHFPIIADIIGDLLPGVTLVNSGAAAAAEVAAVCGKTGGSGSASFFVSDSPVNFDAVARVFLGGETIRAQKVDIEAY